MQAYDALVIVVILTINVFLSSPGTKFKTNQNEVMSNYCSFFVLIWNLGYVIVKFTVFDGIQNEL